MRMIKYTPKFGHCYAIFYAPTFAVGTPFLGIQDLSEGDAANFRICSTGVIVEMNSQFKVMKKLKLIGEPYKIFKNTAFIKGMFTSAVEVAKFTGASIKTVSGIRGSIKRTVKDTQRPGAFRATFEDKILMSDIVFCRTWYSIDVPRFCNPIIAYGKTRMLKSHSQLRWERNLPLPTKKDSTYVHHDEQLDKAREERVFAGLNVPKKIEKELPFKQKQRVSVLNDMSEIDKRRQTNLLTKLSLPTKRPFKKTFMNEQEKQIHSMVQRLAHLDKEFAKKKQESRIKNAEKIRKREQKIQDKRDEKKKEMKKAAYKKGGIKAVKGMGRGKK